MSRILSLHHVILSTKNRRPVIVPENEHSLYRFITKFLEHKRCFVHAVNGMPEHVHVFFDLNPNIALSPTVGELKRESSLWMKQSGLFPEFEGWAVGICGLAVSFSIKSKVIKYIEQQKPHHLKATFDDEIQLIYEKNNLRYHPSELM